MLVSGQNQLKLRFENQIDFSIFVQGMIYDENKYTLNVQAVYITLLITIYVILMKVINFYEPFQF